LLPSGPPKFIPKVYGFKIFGMRGSKYELKFDYKGQPMNEEEIRSVMKKDNKNKINNKKGEEEKMCI
jgi:hypothetical protein